ncbi:MAG: gamma-glutamyltransferase, partial [Sphingobacteriales bacterium]
MRTSIFSIIMLISLSAFAQGTQKPVLHGKNWMAITGKPLAATAGATIFNQGGNAVDAAIAAAITLTVVEPTSNGIGSDGFSLIWDGDRLHGLNASG